MSLFYLLPSSRDRVWQFQHLKCLTKLFFPKHLPEMRGFIILGLQWKPCRLAPIVLISFNSSSTPLMGWSGCQSDRITSEFENLPMTHHLQRSSIIRALPSLRSPLLLSLYVRHVPARLTPTPSLTPTFLSCSGALQFWPDAFLVCCANWSVWKQGSRWATGLWREPRQSLLHSISLAASLHLSESQWQDHKLSGGSWAGVF